MSLEQSVTALEQRNAELVSEVVRARDAVMGLSNMYTTITLGLAGTEDGQYFTVPGNGAYQKLYQHDGAQAPLIATYPSNSDLTDALTTLNTAVSDHVSDADPHTQYVDAAGVHAAFNQYGLGLGQSGFTGDMDTLTSPGSYLVAPAASNGPIGSNPGIVYVSGGSVYADNDRTSQLWIGYSTNKEIYARTQDDGTWSAWQKLLTISDILGTVSQSLGVPTGSIIERGSNTNGEYVKFADGTLICNIQTTAATLFGYAADTFDVNVSVGSIYQPSSSLQWDFPTDFINTNSQIHSILLNGSSLDDAAYGTRSGLTATGYMNFLVNSPVTATGASQRFTLSAIGRWF